MSMTVFHEIESTEPEDIRTAMIAYHKEQMERWKEQEDHTELQRTKREYRAKAEVHEDMAAFWEELRFKPKKS